MSSVVSVKVHQAPSDPSLSLAILTGIGALAGAHRYFSHRAYKAHWLLKLFLLVCQTASGQRSAGTCQLAESTCLSLIQVKFPSAMGQRT